MPEPLPSTMPRPPAATKPTGHLHRSKHWYTTFLASGILLACGVITGVLLARMLGPEERGLLAAIVYWPGFIVGIGALGINEGIVLQIASGDRAQSVVSTSLAIALALSLVAATACWWLLEPALGADRGAYLWEARAYACVFALMSFVSLHLLAVQQGRMHFTRFNAMRTLQVLFYPAALVVLWAVHALDVRTAMVAALAGGVVISIVLLLHFRTELRIPPSFAEARSIFGKSIRLQVVNVLMSLSDQLDKMILVLLATNYQLGQYVVAYTVASAAPGMLVQTYTKVMLPSVAALDRAELGNLRIKRSLAIVALMMLLAGAAVVVLIPLLLPLVFGKQYHEASGYAQILTAALILGGLGKCIVYLLRARQVTAPAVWGQGATSLCLLVGGYLGYRQFGVVGLCWATVFAYATGLAVIWVAFERAIDWGRTEPADNAPPHLR